MFIGVGLAVSRSGRIAAPVSLGPELITNGGFDTDLSGWTLANLGTGTATWSAGTAALTQTADANRGRIRTTLTTIIGRTYRFGVVHAGGFINTAFGTAALGFDVAFQNMLPEGTNTYDFVATATTTHFVVNGAGSSPVTHFVDSVSVKEIL